MVWEKNKILGSSSPFLGCPCSSGKEGKNGGKRKAWLKSSRKSRLGTYHNFLPLCYFFCWFELGLKLALILFWFGLELSFDKDQKCVKRHVGILGEVLSKFS